MKYPTFLPKGTHIRIGEYHEIRHDAVGLVFELSEDVELKNGCSLEHVGRCKVINDPNGLWQYDTVSHTIQLEYDEVIIGLPNKHFANALQKPED